MTTYLFTICRDDGSTPLGQCPEVEVEAEEYLDARRRVLAENPRHEVVSWGVKSERAPVGAGD